MADDHYLVLARKWRPQTFKDVIGQEHVTRTLQNAIRANRIGHAFLFIGSRGIGKTTTARILSKALNCTGSDGPTPEPCCACDNCVSIARGNNIDVIEIDGASNNSVDDVRQIRENVRMVPSQSRYKIYVIDEVHQLSLPAFNALLKTLEEPPPHAVFIMATTEAHKIPATIISRCQRYDFRRVSLGDIVKLLEGILESEQFTCSPEALQAIARAADGGIRDAESILDQLVSYCDKEITFQDVFEVLGLVDWQVLHDLCKAVMEKDAARLLEIVDDIVVSGKDLSQFVQEILRYFRNLLVSKTGAPKELLALPDEEVAEMKERAEQFTLTELIRFVERFSELAGDYDSQLAQRTALEALLIRMCRQTVEVSVETVLEKLLQLEEGGTAPSVASAKDGPQKKKTESVTKGASSPSPLEVTDGNVAEVWSAIVETLSNDDLQRGTWLPQATASHVEGESLVLELFADQRTAIEFLNRGETRRALEEALRAGTANLRTYHVSVQQGPAPVTESVEGNGLPVAPGVDLALAKAAMEDPSIAKVMDVFKGRMVKVQPPTSSPE